MTARYATVNYDRLHRFSEVIFRMLMVKMRVNLKTYLREGLRRCPV